jgi:hypothetical protein
MHPLLKQCYESAVGAKSLASAIKDGEMSVLRDAQHAYRIVARAKPYWL